MTISTVNDTDPRREYTATGGQTVFSVPFEFFADADLLVYLTPVGQDPDDATDILTLTTDYTVSGADTSGGGNLTLVVAATAGDTIFIEANDAIDRSTAFLSNGDLTIASMNEELNKLVMLNKQLSMLIESRSLLFQHTAKLDGVSPDIPTPEAGTLLGWNNTATALSNITQLNDKYLGSQASEPTTDLQGNALEEGDMYFNSTTNDMWVYDGASFGLFGGSVATSANAVTVADGGGYFTGADLELVTQELGAAGAAQANRQLFYFNTTAAAADQLDCGWFKIRSAGVLGQIDFDYVSGVAQHVLHRKGGASAYTQSPLATTVSLAMTGFDVYEVFIIETSGRTHAYIRMIFANASDVFIDITWNE